MTKNKSEKKSNKPGKKKSNSKGENKRMKKEAMINAIINVFKSSPKEPFNYRQISSMIGVTNQVQKLQVVDILYDLSSGADNCTDHLLGYVDLLYPRGMGLELGPGLGYCLLHDVKDMHPAAAGLLESLFENLI